MFSTDAESSVLYEAMQKVKMDLTLTQLVSGSPAIQNFYLALSHY